MLGLWKTDDGAQRHFAFRVCENSIDDAPALLADRDIELRSAFDVEPENQPLVFPRTALASVFFYDPDGNSLELAAVLSKPTNRTVRRCRCTSGEGNGTVSIRTSDVPAN